MLEVMLWIGNFVLDVLAWAGILLGIAAVLAIAIIPIAWLFGAFGFFKNSEGTGAAFKLFSKYCCSVMSLKGFHIDPLDEFIKADTGPGDVDNAWLRWDIWPILQIRGWVIYLKWFAELTRYDDQNNADGFGEGFSVFLNQIQRDMRLEKAETKKGEEIPLNLRAAFKLRVVNIYLFLFIAPKDVIAKVIEIMEAIMRAWIKANTYDKVQEVSSNGGKMWDQFGDDIKAAIKKIKDDWGVEILEESIAIMDIGLQPEDQAAFAEKKRQKLKTAAVAQELVGGMLENEAQIMGFTGDDRIEKVLEKLEGTVEGKKKLEAMVEKANQVITRRALGVKPIIVGDDGAPMDPLMATVASIVGLIKGASNTPTI